MSSSGSPATPSPSIESFLNGATNAASSLTTPLPTYVPGTGSANTVSNYLLGSIAPETAAANSQVSDLYSQLGLGNETVGLTNAQTQTQGGYQLQGLGLQSQGQQLSSQLLGQQKTLSGVQQSSEVTQYQNQLSALQAQYALNPTLQSNEAQQYALSNTQAGQSIQSTQLGLDNAQTQQSAEVANYNLNYDTTNPNSNYNLQQQQLANEKPVLASQAAASGAGNSGQSQINSSNLGIQGQELSNSLQSAITGQGAEVAGFNTSQAQGNLTLQQQQEAQQSAALGQSSEVAQYGASQNAAAGQIASAKSGQTAETAGYKYSQQALQNQAAGLTLAEKQTGLSKNEINSQISSAIQSSNLGGRINTAQVLEQIASTKGQGGANIAQAVQAAYLAQQSAAKAKKK